MDDKPEQGARRILFVSYWYPPAVGAAAERLYGFARHLPLHGWETHVLTAGEAVEHDSVQVHAVRDPLARSGAGFGNYDPRTKPSRLKALLRTFVFPDRFVRWRAAAIRAGSEIVQRVNFDLVLASFPPASVVQLGVELASLGRSKLVLDMRDRWISPGGYEPVRRRTLLAHQGLERAAVAAADAIVTVSDAMAEAIAEEQQFDRKRIFVVPNGYMPGTFQHPAPQDSPGRPFTISHIGTVSQRNRPDLFFDALRQANDQLGNVRFRFVGNLSQAYIDDSGLDHRVTTTGLVAREIARQEMRDADALLLLTGDYVGRWGHNAKMFEYIGAGRPILCLEETPGSNDRRLLEQLVPSRVHFAGISQADELARAVDAIRDVARQTSTTHQVPDNVQAYGRDQLAARLAEQLEAIVS